MSVDWAAVYRATYADLVRYLHRKVWDAERAHDLAQEVFMRALDREPDNPRAWLFHVAGNLARDEARLAARRRRHAVFLRIEAAVREPAPDAAASLEEQERAGRVRRALEQVGERDREVLLLWDAGLSYREIAAQSGLSVGAIGTTLARARRRLADAYHALEEENVARG